MLQVTVLMERSVTILELVFLPNEFRDIQIVWWNPFCDLTHPFFSFSLIQTLCPTTVVWSPHLILCQRPIYPKLFSRTMLRASFLLQWSYISVCGEQKKTEMNLGNVFDQKSIPRATFPLWTPQQPNIPSTATFHYLAYSTCKAYSVSVKPTHSFKIQV